MLLPLTHRTLRTLKPWPMTFFWEANTRYTKLRPCPLFKWGLHTNKLPINTSPLPVLMDEMNCDTWVWPLFVCCYTNPSNIWASHWHVSPSLEREIRLHRVHWILICYLLFVMPMIHILCWASSCFIYQPWCGYKLFVSVCFTKKYPTGYTE